MPTFARATLLTPADPAAAIRVDGRYRPFAALGTDHRREADGGLDATVSTRPGLRAPLELRLNPEQAERQRGFDPPTLAVAERAALADWIAQRDTLSVSHSAILTAIQARLAVLEDPDGHRPRLSARERHGRAVKTDGADSWLQDQLRSTAPRSDPLARRYRWMIPS